jgi:hypothetical protein
VIKKIGLALALMTVAGAASAFGPNGGQNGNGYAPYGNGQQCQQILWFEFCSPSFGPAPVAAPEIDPASAMAGLSMLAGGLAVLRGRRSKISKK